MEAASIISRLKKTHFKFTEVNKIRDILKTMDEEDRNTILRQLRACRGVTENSDIHPALDELLGNFTYN